MHHENPRTRFISLGVQLLDRPKKKLTTAVGNSHDDLWEQFQYPANFCHRSNFRMKKNQSKKHTLSKSNDKNYVSEINTQEFQRCSMAQNKQIELKIVCDS